MRGGLYLPISPYISLYLLISLAQAETVRLATANSGPTPVTALTAAEGGNAADVLLVRSTGRGTHVGRAIGGRVAER